MTDFPRSTNASVRNLVTASYGQGVTLWIYRHDGPIEEALALDFSGCRTMFDAYDPIYLRASDGGAFRCIRLSPESVSLEALL